MRSLYPEQNKSRAVMSLDGMWRFKIDNGEAASAHWEEEFPKESELLYVPASYNDQKEAKEYRTHRGRVFYERSFMVPRFYEGQRLVLRFDAVTHDAVVWLNGRKITEHKGGFLPFEVDVTGLISAGDEARLTVSADNRIGHSSLPVGNEGGTAFFGSDNAQVPAVQMAKKWRGEVNLPNFDFFNYAGIQRHVRLYTTPMEYISDISIVTDIDGNDGIVSYKISAVGENNKDIKVEILDKEGCIAASQKVKAKDAATEGLSMKIEETGDISKDTKTEEKTAKDAKAEDVSTVKEESFKAEKEISVEGEIRIKDASLWEPYPGVPYLYSMRVTFGDDEYTEKFGIRTVKVEGTKLLINSRPFYFKGFGKHEDFYISGRGTSDILNVKDVSLLHWLGANSFRTSHYPYAEEMYRLCDEEGIVIIDETPAVGIGAPAGEDPYRLLNIKDYHKDVLRDMIERDKNHPSVIMWSLGNEPDTEHFPESAYEYWRPLYELAHSLDPQDRPVTMVCCQNDYTRDITTKTMDVVCINRYYGWYNLSGDLDAACYAWNLELDFWAKQNKPVMVTEYGGDTLNGLHGTTAEMFTEEFQTEYYKRLDAEFDKRDFFIGEHCWCFADFGTLQGVMRPDGNRKGVFTRERRPKMAAYFLRDRWNSIPNFDYK